MYRPTAGFPPGRSRRSGLLVDLWILSLLLGMLQLLRSCQVEGLPQDAVFNADQVWNAPNCTNMFCTKGYECFLQEVPCTHSPCKLAAICAANKDVHKWLNDCKKLGCYASSKCFLRASHMKGARTRDRTCDCLDDSTSYYGEPKSLKFCRGWICPPNLMCYAEVEDHKVNRFCDAVRYYQELTDESMPQSSVSETLERDHLIDDLENLKVLTDSEQANAEDEEYDFLLPAANSPVSMESNQAFASIKTKRLSEIPGMKKNFGEDDSAFLIKTAGHKAVQYWIEKSRANNDQDFDDFMKWITLVESLLEPDIYRMWLQKITLATKNVPEFQSWLSMRNLGLRRTTTITRRVTNRARTVVKTNPPPPPVDTDEDTEEEEKPAVANPAAPADSQPINLQAKNLFYSDKNFIFVEPSTNPNHVATFLDKQTVSSLVGNRNFVPTQYQESTTYPQQNPLPIQQYQPQQWSQQNQQQQQLPQQQMPQQQQQQQIPQQQPQMIQQQQQMPQQLQQQQPQQIPQQQPQMIQQQQPQIPQQQQQQQQMPQQLQLLPQQQQPRSQPQEFPLNPQNIVTYNQARAYEDQPTYVYQALPPPLPIVTEAPNIGQGYIMADPRQMPPMMNMQRNSNPTQILLGYTEYPMAQQPENSYYLSNYSQFQNISITASPAFGVQQQIGVQPRFFFPNSQIDFGKTVQSNQWTQRWTNSIPLKRDSQLAEQQQRESSRSEDDPLTMGVGSMIGQLQGLQQMRDNLKPPNLVNLEADRPVSQMMLPNNADNNPGPMPNLLIYFPPPLNFFMYYSVKNDTNPPASVNLKTTVRPTSHRPHVSVESKSSESNEEVGFRTFTGINSESNSSEKSENKEMEYIKKIIKEMIDYWDEKEKSHQKLDDKQSQRNDEAQSTTTPKTSSTTPNLPDEQTKTPTFDAFLEWFSQNSDKKFAFSDRDLHNQRPTPESKDDTTKPPISPDSLDLRQLLGDSKDSGDKKIRILLDVDKNPELIKLLFAQNKMHNNTGDGNEYQVIVNLDDFVKPNEEDLISRRLIDIATNELHRNVTTKQEIPKVLWVFPIYDTENDAAVLSDLEKTTTEKLNAPTTPKFGNPPKRYRHRQQFDRRKNDQRSYMKLRPTQVTILQEKEYNDDSPTTQKENEYDSYDDQSYYDQRDQKSKEENSSKDESA